MELKVGDRFSVTKQVTAKDVELFAEVSGDRNPLHLDADFAAKSMFKQRVVHGMLTASLISSALASMPGTIILTSIGLNFEKPVFIGDNLTAFATVTKIEGSKISFDVEVSTSSNRVISGSATILRR
jgi:3-hydroxybutyryl-CoA dehydratase